MKTRMELWSKYRREINNNSRLKESVQISNQKLNILFKRIMTIIPDYDKKYKIKLDSLVLDQKEISSPPVFSDEKITTLLEKANIDNDYASSLRAIDNIDFSSHELDDVLESIKKNKSVENYFFDVNKDKKSYVSDVQEISIDDKEVRKPNVAIDGPSGSGKSTIAKKISMKFNLRYFNTGLVYRAIAFHCTNNGIDLNNEEEIMKLLNKTKLNLLNDDIVKLNSVDITKEVRSDEASQGASKVAALKLVREWAVKLQKQYAEINGVIMDGRDTTFKIMPNADVKIYLDTSAEIRAKRRVEQNMILGFSTNYDKILEEIKERDARDKNRKTDPLHKTKDAVLINATDLTIEEVVSKISQIINKEMSKWTK